MTEPSESVARRLVDARSGGGRCEGCARPATNFAHRVGRGVGGLWLASNGLKLCGSGTTGCHGWATVEPTFAELCGWRVLSGEHPADVPVWMRSSVLIGWHLLDDEGMIEPLWDRDDVPVLPPWVTMYDAVAPGKSQR